jgi:uncharacterized membrane protein
MRRYHLISTPWRAGVTGGALAGAITGLVFGAEGPSLVVGLVTGVIGGTLYGILIALGARRPLAPLAGLSAGERAAAMGAVHRGLPTTDRRLAPAVVSYAETVIDRHRKWVGTKYHFLIMPLVAVVQVLLAVDDLIDDDAPLAVVRLTSAVIALLVPGWLARGAVRADRAQQSARALLD